MVAFPSRAVDAVPALDVLLGGGHEVQGRAGPDVHVLEVPAEEAPLLLHVEIDEFLAGEEVGVEAGDGG